MRKSPGLGVFEGGGPAMGPRRRLITQNHNTRHAEPHLFAMLCGLLAVGCVKAVQIEAPTEEYWSVQEVGLPVRADTRGVYMRRFTLSFVEFSAEDYESLHPRSGAGGWLFERMKVLDIAGTVKGGLPGRDTDLLAYCSVRGCQEGERVFASLHYTYDEVARKAFVGVEVNAVLAPGLISAFESALIGALRQNGEYELVATRLAVELRAPGRAIEARSSGLVLLESLVDPGTPVRLGGLDVKADPRGHLRFEGRPSMRRVAEGVILLVAEDGSAVVVRRTEDGTWAVLVVGVRGGRPFEELVPVRGLGE